MLLYRGCIGGPVELDFNIVRTRMLFAGVAGTGLGRDSAQLHGLVVMMIIIRRSMDARHYRRQQRHHH